MNQKHKLMSLAAGAVVLCGLGVAFTKNVFAAQPQITVTSLTRSITVENNITLNSSKHYAIDQINHSSLEANEKDEAIKLISNASSSDEVKEIYNKYSKIELDRITAKRNAEEEKKAKEEAEKKAEEERLAQEAAKKAEEERIAKEKAAQEAAAAQAAQAANEQPQSYSAASSSGATISLSQFMFDGVVYWGGYKFTYYSQSVLPGGGLSIPGRHVNADGYVADGDGYIVLAGSAPKGTVYNTPFGYKGKIYDRGTYGNHLDVYIR